MTLGFRLSRRLVAAVALQDDQVVHQDSRYVARRREAVEGRVSRYFDRLLDQLSPTTIWYYAPTRPEALSERLTQLLEASASRHGIPTRQLAAGSLRQALALPVRAPRRAILEHVVPLWPAVANLPRAQQATFAEAAVVAMTGDIADVLTA